jgi:hypothetical protein
MVHPERPDPGTEPIGLYVARVVASFPPGWIPEWVEELPEFPAHRSMTSADTTVSLTSRPPDGFKELAGRSADIPIIAPGAPVRLTGLQTSRLNGRLAICVKQVQFRWEVCLGGGEANVAVQENNLVPEPIGRLEVQITIHIQPRFQVQALRKSLKLHHDDISFAEIEVDSRMVHRPGSR